MARVGEDGLPGNLEAEQAVLGSLLLDRDAIIEVSQILQPEDFALDAHAVIYRVMANLYEQRRPVDFITVLEEIERRDMLGRIGGRGYLTELVNVVPAAIHVEYYARAVERTSILRRLITAGSQIIGIAQRHGIESDAAIGQAEEALQAVAQRRSTSGFIPIHDILAQILERLDYVHENRGAIVGVPTGFADLDKILGGLQRSDLVILGARPAHGKTAMALGMCHNAAVRYKQRVAIFSLEMSKEQLVQRLLCMQGRLDSGRLRSGYIDEEEWTRLIEAAAVLSESKIFIDDSAGVSPAEMRNRARRLQAEHGLDLIVVDYLQLMQGRATENRVQEISGISRALKVLARELNVPVMALSQVSRGVDARTNHVPLLSDLRESGCLAGDTPVYLPDTGTYAPIASLVGRRGFQVLALNTATWRLEPAEVTDAFVTGIKPVYRLTTRLGCAIRATANHKFLTSDGWKRLDELAEGGRVALPRMLQGPQEATMRRDELALLGHLIGDGCTLPRHAIQYTTRGLASVVASPVLAQLAESDVCWDEIVRIEPDGEAEVYDLTVDTLHNFVAADIVVHNSIEQDADVVLFLCREEMYDPETEKRHIADIYVAKHRNGPTGHLALYFDQQQTRFRDLELQGAPM